MYASNSAQVCIDILQLSYVLILLNLQEAASTKSSAGTRDRRITEDPRVSIRVRCRILHALYSLSREDENPDEIVSRHIKLLHRYNEAKDAAQVNQYCSAYTLHLLTS